MPRPSITPTRHQLRAPLTVSAWLLLASLLPACAASTQAPRVRIIPADSSEAHRALLTEAWTAQTAFETFRLQNLPRLFGPFSERQICREPVGRFCVEPGDGSGAWLYIPEPAVIAEERLKLIAALGDIAARIPGDDWVAGQRVRYAVEAGLWDEANQAALDCAGSDWWCLALAGYVLHRQGNAVGADYAFGQALSRMRATERQRWTDPDLILDGALADSARSLVGLDRLTFIYSYWKLADPFLSLPGNELLAEHLARRVEIQFQWAAGFLDGLPWAADLDEMVLRYGLPDSRIRALGADFDLLGFRYYLGPPYGVPDLLTHYTMPAADLLPPFDEMVPGRGEWNRPLSRPRAGYRVLAGDASVEWIPDLSHQTAVFRRGSAVAVVATFDLPAHGFAPDARVDAGLVMLPLDNPLLTPVTTRVEGFTGPGPLALIVEPRPALMSLEVSVPSEGAVGRVRRELSIQPFRVGSVGISDILLYEAAVQRPDSLVDAIAAALPSNRVRPGQEVGVYWEMYGLDPGREPSVHVVAADIGRDGSGAADRARPRRLADADDDGDPLGGGDRPSAAALAHLDAHNPRPAGRDARAGAVDGGRGITALRGEEGDRDRGEAVESPPANGRHAAPPSAATGLRDRAERIRRGERGEPGSLPGSTRSRGVPRLLDGGVAESSGPRSGRLRLLRVGEESAEVLRARPGAGMKGYRLSAVSYRSTDDRRKTED